MVTHNPELAEKYSTRIIKLLDGKTTDDTNPYSLTEEKEEHKAEESTIEKLRAIKGVLRVRVVK